MVEKYQEPVCNEPSSSKFLFLLQNYAKQAIYFETYRLSIIGWQTTIRYPECHNENLLIIRILGWI